MHALHAKAFLFAAIAFPPPASHAGNDLTSCVTLSPQAEAIQIGTNTGKRMLLISDGESRYRIDLVPTDDTAPAASPIRISSRQLPRTLCPNERNVVKAADGRVFHVRRVSTIPAGEFQRRIQFVPIR